MAGFDDNKEVGAVFNMAIATLMRVNEILEQITQASIMPADYNTKCEIKYNLVRQLYSSSIPLITRSEDKADLKNKMLELDKLFKVSYNQIQKVSAIQWNRTADHQLDEFVYAVQEILQKDKYFMPPKDDPKHSWREG